ncbi:hypothetical protein HYDPIDRAFT_135502 [Hydnomerulius pinastri MD-312]|uniref:Uncharacterized protein n=1 Tax=Hydnomerulius pinastri MD-312 TaxID=994086 RepID=A0A0C9WE30_9AGAM|nr:hypothetical protein HYDPIDRAFT_135502 [Hydnomerulius pinastri MD-312]
MSMRISTCWWNVSECIKSGTIPDLEGIAQFRCYLEANFAPNPDRAAELLAIGRPSAQSGWCGRVWPKLRAIIAICRGTFAASVPQAQWFLGPNADIHARGYTASEGWIGSPYDPLNLNQFKLTKKDVIEFLDVTKDETISNLAQAWEVIVGKRYELVMTTRDGFWRYRIGDVVEVCGFDPCDGTPIISFIERRKCVFSCTRQSLLMLFDSVATDAILSVAPHHIGQVVEFTVIVDDRMLPATFGYFVELANDAGPHSELAPQLLLEALIEYVTNLTFSLEMGRIRKPSINIVAPGTFAEFRQRRLDKGSTSLGQIKVPVVLTDRASVAWILEKVVREL